MITFRISAICLLFIIVYKTSCSIIPNQKKTEEPVHVHDSDWNETEDIPSQILASLHSPSENELKIDQLSRLLLIITKDLVSAQPRTKVDQNLGTSEKLASLRSLDPEDVRSLLSGHSIYLPRIHNRTCGFESLYYRTMDGSCNNLQNPCWGKTDEPYQRWLPPDYANGIDEPRRSKFGYSLPNPRQILQGISNPLQSSEDTTYGFFTNLVVVWGQMVAHDILLTPTFTVKVWNGKEFKNEKPHCCKSVVPHPECISILLNNDDEYFSKGYCMDMARSSAYMFSPYSCSQLKLGKLREQMNQLTTFIDASLVYGVTEDKMRKLRENGGYGAKLIMDSTSGWSYLPRKNASVCKSSSDSCSKECFLAGEKRVNENPVLAAMHTLWAREHNRLVDLLRIKGWSEEMLFHVVRKIVGAMLQHTTYKEYLPVILGPTLMNAMKLTVPSEHYKYDDSVNPTLYNAFTAAAFRFGHSMVSSRHERAGKQYNQSPYLSEDFFSMDEYCNPHSDALVSLFEGQLRQKVEKVDSLFSKQLTNHLFAKTANDRGLDLFSINVQRGRDHGLPSYNEWRKVCGLPAAQNYSDLRGMMPDYVIERLQNVYGPDNVDDIDLFAGGISEFSVNDGILGPTFTCIVANQFRNLKVGDRFWYENLNNPGTFTKEQIASIQKTTIASLICRNTGIKEMPYYAFLLESNSNPKMSCESLIRQTDIDLGVW